jgi:hypothetical protein
VQDLRDIDAGDLTLDQIELIEKVSLRLAYQALVWFAPQAWHIFNRSPDHPQSIAEDITREAIGEFKGFSINERLFGTLDFKQARWLPMPFGRGRCTVESQGPSGVMTAGKEPRF